MLPITQGCREQHTGDGFKRDQPDWVAVTNSNYSYTRMTVHNLTHVTLQQISIDLVFNFSHSTEVLDAIAFYDTSQGGDVFDEITVVKHKHGPYH